MKHYNSPCNKILTFLCHRELIISVARVFFLYNLNISFLNKLEILVYRQNLEFFVKCCCCRLILIIFKFIKS